ncbi:MAG: alpha/beta hydrolase [Clostridiales bacterium]|nr:alpha/beta hydrolase [Clostridiales bacterium]
MMKKRALQIISTVLAIIFLVSMPAGVMALATQTPACNCGYDPVIFVTGIASIDIYKNLGSEQETVMFPPSMETIKAALTPGTFTDLAKFAITGNWDYVADALIPVADKVLEDFGCNPDGTPKAGTGIKWSYPPYPIHTPDYAPGFYYDWREDPIVLAVELHDYIEYVCAATGHDKVNLIAYSMGSICTMTYLERYGYDRVAGLVLSAAALNGVSVAGEPFAGNIKFDPVGLVRYIDSMITHDEQGNLIMSLLSVLEKVGVIKSLTHITDKIIKQLEDRVYAEVLTPMFGTSLGMWSLLPDAYYEQAKDLLLSDKQLYAELIAKADDYHYNVQMRNEEIINGAIARGIKFGIILKYNLQGFPIGNSVNNSTDTVIDAKYASFGATVAPLGETLGKDYVQAVNCGHNHISPDQKIDASTGSYPEQTWFVRDFVHMRDAWGYDDLINYIFFSPEQVTVFSDAARPQFLRLIEKTNTIVPLETKDEAVESPFWGNNSLPVVVFRLIAAVIALLRMQQA